MRCVHSISARRMSSLVKHHASAECTACPGRQPAEHFRFLERYVSVRGTALPDLMEREVSFKQIGWLLPAGPRRRSLRCRDNPARIGEHLKWSVKRAFGSDPHLRVGY